PIGFPQEGGKLKGYSNLLYWAHAWSDEGSTIGLHPHKGFEIMSFVLKGSIDHFDTKQRKWIPLEAGGAQIIRSGSGISHSERLNAGAHMFQIWFDPGLSSTLQQPASYDDYTDEDFPVTEENGITIKWYKGRNSPLKMDSLDVTIKEMTFDKGLVNWDLNSDMVYSIYLLDGEFSINQQEMEVDDFALVYDMKEVMLQPTQNARIFVIETPKELPYRTYLSQYN
ncbi:MAG: pirin family protein, partial [Bacteroidota bacterium]